MRDRNSMISETYNIDCMDYMKTVPDKHFDLAICDPPYGERKNGISKRVISLYLEKLLSYYNKP